MREKSIVRAATCLAVTVLVVLMSIPQEVRADTFRPTCFAEEEINGSGGWQYFYILDVSGAVTEYVFNSKGLLVKETNPLGEVILYEYDGLNRLFKKKTPDGTVTEYSYTEKGMVTKITAYSANGKTETLEYCYAPDGSLTMASSSSTVDKYTYAPNGKIETLTRNGKYRLEFAYDEIGNLTELKEYRCGIDVPDAVTTYTYNASGKLETVVQDGMLVAEYQYDSLGRIQSQSDGTGNITTYSYDNGNKLVLMETRTSEGTVLYKEENKYNAKESVISRVISGLAPEVTGVAGSFLYTYDESDRLLMEQGTYGTIHYAYDSMGNRLTKTENGETTTYVYDLCNKLISENTDGATISYTYDAMGNLIEKSGDDGTMVYTYNLWNLPDTIVNSCGESQKSSYDAFGIRSVLDENGVVTEYITYDGIVIAGYNSEGERTEHYTYGNKILAWE